MRLKESFNIRKIGDEYMMISQSDSGLDYTRVITLNESAAFLIEQIKEKEFTNEELIELLINKYGIDRYRAEEDVKVLIKKMEKEGIIIEE